MNDPKESRSQFRGQTVLSARLSTTHLCADHRFPVAKLLSGITIAPRSDRNAVEGEFNPPREIGTDIEHPCVMGFGIHDVYDAVMGVYQTLLSRPSTLRSQPFSLGRLAAT